MQIILALCSSIKGADFQNQECIVWQAAVKTLDIEHKWEELAWIIKKREYTKCIFTI